MNGYHDDDDYRAVAWDFKVGLVSMIGLVIFALIVVLT